VQIDVTQGRPSPTIAADAADAEVAGFDGFWVGETHTDPFLRVQRAADATREITVGTAVAIAFARTPMTVAYSGYDLAGSSDGRFVLGLGSQVKAHIERRFAMPWSHPATRMREFVLALRAIWASWEAGAEPLAFEGEFYAHSLMTPFFSPDPHPFGGPPVYLAAVGEMMTGVAGEVADGLIIHPFTTPRYLAEVTRPALAAGAARADRSLDVVTVSGPVFACVGSTDSELATAIEGSRRQLAFYASTPAYRRVLELHGWGDLQPELTALSKRGEWEAMGALVDDEILYTFAVAGSPAEVVAQLTDRWGGLADRVSLYTPYEVPAATLRAVAAARRATA
jgi:probable F420-dependent oxidoreductase